MNKLLLFMLLSFSSSVFSQDTLRQWKWMHGNSTIPQYAVYGMRGVPNGVNNPGAREDAISWTDSSGNQWLYGGFGNPNRSLQESLNSLWKYSPSLGQWTWVSGDNTTGNQPGVYGTKGIAASTNNPGARIRTVGWTDTSGNLWLFGGFSRDNNYISGAFNDLWKYSPSTGLWTWMSGDNISSQAGVYGTRGVAASTNKPGARQSAVSWTDASGNFWLFGGVGYASTRLGDLNDLWKYSPSNGLWTWMSGDNFVDGGGIYGTKGIANNANKPGTRYSAISWADSSGNLWLFGGTGFIANNWSGDLNDLWKYSLVTGQWSWMSGDSALNMSGLYETKGVASTSKKPGSRTGAVSWTDPSGDLWLFGGSGRDYNRRFAFFNDLWKYAPSSGMWIWMSGDSTGNEQGVYGTKGTTAGTNKPGARYKGNSWMDRSGILWLFGGTSITEGGGNVVNDLWQYAVSTGQWTWVSGDSSSSLMGRYGTQGIAEKTNIPGTRRGTVSWADTSGNLWLFGGSGYLGNTYSVGYFNDLWKYSPDSGNWAWISGDKLTNQPGVYGTRGIAASTNKPRARQGAVSWTDGSGNFWLFGGSDYTGSTFTMYLNDLWKYSPYTGLWTWVSGDSAKNKTGVYGTKGIASAANKPRPRNRSVSWIDSSGNLWLFGGEGWVPGGPTTNHLLNDLWKYSPSTDLWTWMGGDSTENQKGVYGNKGTANAINKPGARVVAVGWTDASGDLWLFGGNNAIAPVTPGPTGGSFNDLWRYSLSTAQWTWINGDSTINQPGVYGTKGLAAASNKPGAKYGAVGCTDSTGNFWLFGGGVSNDLWRYSPSTGWWTWISGENTNNAKSVYGTKGIAASTNQPGGRNDALGWMDKSGNFWLWGGYGNFLNGIGDLNDLWLYSPAAPVVLPIRITGFTAEKQLQHVMLNWKTIPDPNSDYFIIERSFGGLKYDSIASVKALGSLPYAAGYSYVDVNPIHGTNYYRLRHLYKDDTHLYSSVIRIDMDKEEVRFTLLQNPVYEALHLKVQLPAAQKINIQVRDVSGRLLLKEERVGSRGSVICLVPVNHLARGMYIIRMQAGGSSSTKTFIKQ